MISNSHKGAELACHADRIVLNLFAYLDGIGIYYLMNRQHIDVTKQVDLYPEQLLHHLSSA